MISVVACESYDIPATVSFLASPEYVSDHPEGKIDPSSNASVIPMLETVKDLKPSDIVPVVVAGITVLLVGNCTGVTNVSSSVSTSPMFWDVLQSILIKFRVSCFAFISDMWIFVFTKIVNVETITKKIWNSKIVTTHVDKN